MKLSRLFNSARKRIAAGAIVALAIVFPVAVSAANTVNIDADTTVANATTSGSWAATASASYNQVVDVQVLYNNTEAPDSGKTANNVRVKINIPTTAGTTQAITSATSSDNSNTVNGTATVTLDRADAYLQYIPGTATWKHATTANGGMTTTQKVSDDVVTNPNGLVLGNENPCEAGSIQVQARVLIPGVKVTKQVRVKGGSSDWANSVTATPGATVQYLISYTNDGNTDEQDVVIGDKLPDGVTYVAGSTNVANQASPNGQSVADGLTTSGLSIGTYTPTANAFVWFTATLPSEDKLACGTNTLTNVASAQPKDMPAYLATATVTVTKQCNEQTPTYSCDAFHVTVADNRTVKVDTFKFTASNNASLDMVTLNWGDTTTPLNTNNIVGQQHQYGADGTYTISLSNFKVGGKTVDVTGNCSQEVSFTTPTTPPTTPPELPNTGAGNVIGLVAGAIAAGTIGYRLFLSRKLARR